MLKSAKKSLGQHFIFNPRIQQKIASYLTPQDSEVIIEIGGGYGHLTKTLLHNFPQHTIYTIEKDEILVQQLQLLQIQYPQLHVVHGDALQLNLSHYLSSGRSCCLVGNLPYNISSQILCRLLSQRQLWQCMLFMFQKEMAKRIVATPDTKHFGRLAIATSLLAQAKIVYHIAAKSFHPPPKVDSTVVLFQKNNQYPLLQLTHIENLTQRLFSQRRKMLRSILNSQEVLQLQQGTSIILTKRPQEVSLSEYVQMIDVLG